MRWQPIIEAKISMPGPPRWAPPRGRASAVLDRGFEVGVTVVAAGPGYLKQQAVESWVSVHDHRVAWLSLDDADDPVRLLAHLLAAVRAAAPDFDQEVVLDDLIGPGDWRARASDAVVEALGELTEPLVIVFDGVHRLTDPESRRGVETMIRYRPDPLRIVLLTRDDAAIDLATPTMTGAVVEMREADLRLDVEETLAMLRSAEADAGLDDAVALHEATDGWPAGIALAATRRTTDGRIAPFAADEEPVQSYLRNRVLDSLEPGLAEFFLQMAPLGSVSAELAAHVTGRTDAGRALDRLVDLHLLFDHERSRPGWKTFPAHLQRFALHEYRSGDHEAARALCHRAATWCWERELLDESMTIAACAGDTDLMGEILLEHHFTWTAGGQANGVRSWCATLLQHDPQLVEAQLAAAWAALYLADDAGASSAVALLDADGATGDRRTLIDGEAAIIRSHLARRRGEMDVSYALARAGAAAAERLGPDFSTPYRGALPSDTDLHVGMAALWANHLEEAFTLLEVARRSTGRVPGSLPIVHGHLAIVHWLLDHAAARAHVDAALNQVQGESLGAGHLASLAMALILGVDGVGQQTLTDVLALAESLGEPAITVLADCAEASFLAETDPARARDALRRARKATDSCLQPGFLTTLVARVAAIIGVDRDPALGDPLTEGEQRVLRMLSGPLTEREIATELHLSHNTVRTYRRRLYRKLGFTSRDDVESMASPPVAER